MERLALSQLAEVINKLNAKALDPALRKDMDDSMCGLDCGQYLLEAKGRLPQQEWEVWVRDHLDFDLEDAEGYIRLYRRSF
jgi:hypothetical protein